MNSEKLEAVAGVQGGDLERFPFPVISVDPDFELLERNRLAQKLLLPPWQLRRYLKELRKKGCKERFFVSSLENRSYFVALLSRPSGYWIAFLENLFYFYEPLTRPLLGEGVELMGQWQDRERFSADLFGQEKHRALSDRITARTCRLREQMSMLHRLLSLSGRAWQEPCWCDVAGLIRILQRKLKEHRITLELDSTAQGSCPVSPEALIAAVVNLVQFVLVYEGESHLHLCQDRGETTQVLHVSFREREGLFSDFSKLFESVGTGKELPGVIGLAPLFSAMILCRENGMKMELFSDGDVGRIDLILPNGKDYDVQFLGTKLGKEEAMAEAWIRQILFPYAQG